MLYQIRDLTCTGSPGPLVASQQSLKRPGVLQVGHLARMQRGTGVSSLTVEPAKKPRVSSHESSMWQ